MPSNTENAVEEKIVLRDDADVVAAWKAALALGRRAGFGLFKQACLSGAVLELCRQAVERGGGACMLADVSDAGSIRARVCVEGVPQDLLAQRARAGREINVGPALPAVRLHQVAETLRAEPINGAARIALTIHQSRSTRASRTPGDGRRPRSIGTLRSRP